MRIDVVTLFPEMVEAVCGHSIVKRAREAAIVEVNAVPLRDFAEGRHRITDDTPCGGGGGMVMKVEPVARALDALCADGAPRRVVLTCPQGRSFTQEVAREYAAERHLVIVCGHYEGVDERVREHLVDDEVSIGDYVLTGGELPALVIVDAVVRLLPGALGDAAAPHKDSFSDGLLEHPQYTRPRSYRGWDVPEALFSGHHAAIEQWRRWHRLRRTRERRPDLWARFERTPADEALVDAPEPMAPS
ncbi:MAG TPA: tRNA (guanosine(37)-N1)-methyltransferase TrmD [Chthonomonadales bacterium]|nr:tRNA (guanosine(37)-N1)-methyltransferase TrmD [Chthonomonadales bacterium]